MIMMATSRCATVASAVPMHRSALVATTPQAAMVMVASAAGSAAAAFKGAFGLPLALQRGGL
eukprot:CAMPEP_0194558944 /NCGR_PEP_ID=MMETSP0292-20121207/669_1 /TAXON_ID=39354 /ORGANISM="Heterosigma akashiwo, Strain CCMP2393" /LENGTH=61 /DNA_ID=CAMNT_0039406719 /DNA_START=497 /DNA_END=682 /DNA_ORIENTATION=+